MKTGLVLSGGGARGIAHIGVLQALQEMNITLHALSGTSAGSMVAALYCAGYNPGKILEIFQTNRFYKLVWPALKSSGLLNMRKMERTLIRYFPENSFEVLRIPLYVYATNLRTGEGVMFHKGPLVQSLLASSAIPVLFHPQST